MTEERKQRLLVTGASGFLAGYIARHFSSRGWETHGVDRNPPADGAKEVSTGHAQMSLPDAALDRALREFAPDLVIHCAGRASVPLSMEDPATDFEAGPSVTFATLDALRRVAPEARFIHLSSAAVYGNPASLPVGEDAPCNPLSPYGFHKRMGEELCREFATVYGLKTISVRLFSAYGEGLRRQVMWDICRKALSGDAVSLQGTGRETRDFLHARDIARGLEVIAESAELTGGVCNLASGRQVEIGTLARILLKALGRDEAPEFDGRNPEGYPLKWQADISRTAALGFAPTVDIERGAADYAAWARRALEEG